MRDKTAVFVSIVVPAHNEEEIIGEFVGNAVRLLRTHKLNGEILVVENGSGDKTLTILESLQKKYKELAVWSLPHGNKGLALKCGLKKARGEYLITLDADLWDGEFVLNSITELKKYEVVIGSRTIEGGLDARPLTSRVMNKLYNFIFKLFFDFRGTETHAKLAFRRSKILPLIDKCRAEDLVFDTELIIRAERAGLSKAEIPTSVKEIRPRRYSFFSQLVKTAKNFIVLLRALGPSPNRGYLSLFAVLALAAFLRLYKFKEWFYFAMDEEHYAYMTRMITVNHHFPAIGGPVSGTDLYLSPLFLYLNAIPYFLTNNNPLSAGFLTTVLGVLTALFVYKTGKEFFNPKTGALAGLLYAASMLMVIFDRHWWNISLTAFTAIFSVYGVFKIIKKDYKWALFVWVVLTVGVSAHFSNMAALIFVVIAWVVFKLPLKNKYVLAGLAVFLLAHLPIAVFDLRHNFWETRAAVKFFSEKKYQKVALGERLLNTADLAAYSFSRAVYPGGPSDLNEENSLCPEEFLTKVKPPFWGYLGMLGVFGFFVLYSFKNGFRKLLPEPKLIFLLLAINFVFLALFRVDPSERHFLPSYGLFFVLAGLAAGRLEGLGKLGKLGMLGGISILVLLNSISFLSSRASFGYADKEKAVKIAGEKAGANPFYFDSVGKCQIYGYRYIFSELGFEPAASYLDGDFGWMYDKKPTKNYNLKVIFFNPSIYKPELKSEIAKVKNANVSRLVLPPWKVGNIEIWLVKNEIIQQF